MKIKKIDELRWWKSYQTDEKQYIKNKWRILYSWEYMSHSSFELVKWNTTTWIIENFQIPIVYNNYDKEYWNIIEVSQSVYDNLYHTLPETTIGKQPRKYLSVKVNSSTIKINNFLENILYDNFILSFKADNKQKMYHLIKYLYTNIEDILLEDISETLEQYKKEKNINNFFNKDKTKIKNQIIQEKLDNISANINDFVLKLDNNTISTLLSNPFRKWRSIIIKQSKKYLMERYHHNEIKYLSYKEALDSLNIGINQIYYLFWDEIPEIKKGDDVSKEVFYIERLRKDLISYINNIKTTINKDSIDDLINEIDEIVFDPFIREYYELDEDEDTWIQSRILSEDFANIKNSIKEIVDLIEYKEMDNNNNSINELEIDILSARDIFGKICLYNKSNNDNENLISTINKLKECDDKEIDNMLSKHNLQELLNILVNETQFEFAARIRDIIKNKF